MEMASCQGGAVLRDLVISFYWRTEMERGAVGCLSNVFMTVEWRTRDFLCAALLISYGEEVAEWLKGF